MGGDDCMEIYLTDRKKGNKALVLWLGSSTFAEAVFWLDNESYIIAGYEYYGKPYYFIKVNGFCKREYHLPADKLSEKTYFRYSLDIRGVIQ
jgi:hypothetical protein